MMLSSRNRSTKRKLSIYVTALFALMALGGAMASGASAASEWRVAGQTLHERGLSSETTKGSGSLEFAGKILGAPTRFQCSVNSAGSIASSGRGNVSMTLEGCTVSEPAGCTVKPTSPLTANLEPIAGVASKYQKLVPASGSKFGVFKFSLCSIAGTYPLTGTLARSASGSITESVSQPFEMSAAVSSAAGTAALLGPEPVVTTGTVTESLSGGNSGAVWGGPYESRTSGLEWHVGGSVLSSPQSLSANGSAKLTLHFLGANAVINCSGLGIAEGQINKLATSEGSLGFSGCAMSEPAGCGVASTIRTERVHSTMQEIAGRAYETFKPIGGQFFSLKITGCSLSGTYPVRGSFTGLGSFVGVEQVTQPLTFSAAVDSEAGSGMTVGSEPAGVEGSMTRSIGSPWGAFAS